MKVFVLATNACMVSAVYGMLDVLFAANFCIKKRYGEGIIQEIDCQIVTIDNKPVVGYNGIQIIPTQSIDMNAVPDIVVVSSTVEVVVDCCGEEITYPNKEKIEEWLNICHKKGSTVASYCTGSFLLASSGLLNGKTATTHWRSADLFRRTFPFVKLDCEQLIVNNGNVICSGGSMSYIDLALHLTELHAGKDIVSDCAKLIVFDPVRQKQSPYVTFNNQKKHDDQAILKAQEWMESHFKKEVSIDKLADRVGLGSRTFKRRFKQATNENPINYVQRLRVEHVKEKLEKTTETINNIVWSVGYEDLSSFRQLFKRFTGLTPKEYRQKFT